MAQGNQDDLITWLESNKLHFIKDALISADYTLEIIVNMTDKDIDDIFDELKMSKLKKPLFRNAVKRLKEKPQSQPQTQKKFVISKTENKQKDTTQKRRNIRKFTKY